MKSELSLEAPPPPDHELTAGTLKLAGIELEVRYVPGHAPGHVMLYSSEDGVAFAEMNESPPQCLRVPEMMVAEIEAAPPATQ